MSGLPYLPLYIDDYEAATAHLSMLEDGAYMRLLRLCWRTPGCRLPDDEPWILRKLRATSKAEIAAVQAILSEFFTRSRGKIFSQRLLNEFLQISVTLQAKKEGGKRGGVASALKRKQKAASIADSMPQAKLHQPEPEPEPEPKEEKEGGGGSARGADLPVESADRTFRESLLSAIGADPVSGLTGPNGRMIGTQADMAEVCRWLALPGMTEAAVLTEVRRCMAEKRDGPPSSVRYFTPAMQRLSGAIASPALSPVTNGQPRAGPKTVNLDAIWDKIEADARADAEPKGRPQ